jgi:nanoRNase/pAp phosphatase (c-di-AMP/oligoRNAs hydrolase)
MQAMFYEIDCGPGGIVWELHSDVSDYLRSYDTEADMMYDAALLNHFGHEVKFYTQAEYNLSVQMDTLIENEIFSRRLDSARLSPL